MGKLRALLFVILAAVFLTGCMSKDGGNKDTDTSRRMQTLEDMGSVENEVDSKSMTLKTSGSQDDGQIPDKEIPTEQQQRLIIRTGTMNLEVETFGDAETKINELVKSLNGYTSATSSSQNAAGKKQGAMTIKVPAEKFDELLVKLADIGEISSQNITSSDVTEEYIDLTARLKTERELEQRLISLLDTKAANLSDIIEIEGKLATVRQKIESVQGRMKYLMSQSSYSTLTVNIYEPSLLETSSGGGFFYEIGQAFKDGLEGFTDVLKIIITAAIALLPLLLFLALLVYVIIRIIKWYNKRKASKSALEATKA